MRDSPVLDYYRYARLWGPIRYLSDMQTSRSSPKTVLYLRNFVLRRERKKDPNCRAMRVAVLIAL
jgi:hypothetical protein